MELNLVQRFDTRREWVREQIKTAPPNRYIDVVRLAVGAVAATPDSPERYGEELDPERITCVDYGDYQGTLVFVIGAEGYQPSTHYAVSVGYGSCSGCDTLEAIRTYTDEPLTDQQVTDYFTLVLHVVQGIKRIGASV